MTNIPAPLSLHLKPPAMRTLCSHERHLHLRLRQLLTQRGGEEQAGVEPEIYRRAGLCERRSTTAPQALKPVLNLRCF
jgi:hypothetical protein